jgi:hypothetical protein
MLRRGSTNYVQYSERKRNRPTYQSLRPCILYIIFLFLWLVNTIDREFVRNKFVNIRKSFIASRVPCATLGSSCAGAGGQTARGGGVQGNSNPRRPVREESLMSRVKPHAGGGLGPMYL